MSETKLDVIQGDADKLTDEEKNHTVTRLELRKFVREEMIRQNQNIQTAFNEQAQHWMVHQSQYNQVFNAVNAIVRVLYKKGLITNELLEQAGHELALEARQNIEQMKLMQSNKQAYDPSKMRKSALDEAIAAAVTPTRGKSLREIRTVVESYSRREEK